jgi:NADH oxidase (H2O2-forming)
MAKSLVIIGGGDAGTYVLESLFRKQVSIGKDLNITLLKREKYGSFSICGLPYALQKLFSIKALEIAEPKFFVEKGVDYRTSTEVTGIKLEDRSISVSTGADIKYDYLVIGTGRKPFIPNIDGIELKGVYTVNNLEDGEQIEASMNDPETKSALVIGGGSIGLQIAVAFSKKGFKTTVVHSRRRSDVTPSLIPSMLDGDMASIIQEMLEKEGINFVLGKPVISMKGDGNGKVKTVVLEGEEISADIVVISAGMRPNVGLAKKAGIDIGITGGIITDQFMHVKKSGKHISNVYALGDCVEVIDAITHQPRLSQLASTALVQAKVVVDNVLDLDSSFEPCLSPTVADISGLQVGSVGITSEIAHRYGIKLLVGKKTKPTKPRYCPERKSMTVKLLFDSTSEQLIGAQIISEEQVADRIDGLSLAIKSGLTAKDLHTMEKSFDPTVALHRDVMVDAAEDAIEKAV